MVVLPALVMAQIEPLFLMNRSAFISRIVIDILMFLLGIFFRGTYSVRFKDPLFNKPVY